MVYLLYTYSPERKGGKDAIVPRGTIGREARGMKHFRFNSVVLGSTKEGEALAKRVIEGDSGGASRGRSLARG